MSVVLQAPPWYATPWAAIAVVITLACAAWFTYYGWATTDGLYRRMGHTYLGLILGVTVGALAGLLVMSVALMSPTSDADNLADLSHAFGVTLVADPQAPSPAKGRTVTVWAHDGTRLVECALTGTADHTFTLACAPTTPELRALLGARP